MKKNDNFQYKLRVNQLALIENSEFKSIKTLPAIVFDVISSAMTHSDRTGFLNDFEENGKKYYNISWSFIMGQYPVFEREFNGDTPRQKINAYIRDFVKLGLLEKHKNNQKGRAYICRGKNYKKLALLPESKNKNGNNIKPYRFMFQTCYPQNKLGNYLLPTKQATCYTYNKLLVTHKTSTCYTQNNNNRIKIIRINNNRIKYNLSNISIPKNKFSGEIDGIVKTDEINIERLSGNEKIIEEYFKNVTPQEIIKQFEKQGLKFKTISKEDDFYVPSEKEIEEIAKETVSDSEILKPSNSRELESENLKVSDSTGLESTKKQKAPKKKKQTVKERHGGYLLKFRKTYFAWNKHVPQTSARQAHANTTSLDKIITALVAENLKKETGNANQKIDLETLGESYYDNALECWKFIFDNWKTEGFKGENGAMGSNTALGLIAKNINKIWSLLSGEFYNSNQHGDYFQHFKKLYFDQNKTNPERLNLLFTAEQRGVNGTAKAQDDNLNKIISQLLKQSYFESYGQTPETELNAENIDRNIYSVAYQMFLGLIKKWTSDYPMKGNTTLNALNARLPDIFAHLQQEHSAKSTYDDFLGNIEFQEYT